VIPLSPWQRLASYARRAVPSALTLLLLFLGILPWNMPAVGPVNLSLMAVAVYYWTLYEPQLMPVWGVAIIGLIGDLLGIAPLGAGMLTTLFIYGVTLRRRRDLLDAGFWVGWLGFAIIGGIATLINWLLVCYLKNGLVDPRPAQFHFALSLVCYPAVAYLFGRIHRSLLRTL